MDAQRWPRASRLHLAVAGICVARRSARGPVTLEPVREFFGVREGGQVTARHLIGCEAQALACDSALKLRRKESVGAAQEKTGRHVGPRRERTRLLENLVGSLLDVRRRLRDNGIR